VVGDDQQIALTMGDVGPWAGRSTHIPGDR
jgi:hypothetical protein